MRRAYHGGVRLKADATFDIVRGVRLEPDLQFDAAFDIVRGVRLEPDLQFSVGRSARSITSTRTGPRCESSLSPSCSWTAVKIDGPSGSIGTPLSSGSGAPGGRCGMLSGVHVRVNS